MRVPRRFTKRRRVLGLPIGKRQIDWASVQRVGMMGVGAASSVIGGVQAWREGGTSAALGQVLDQTRKASDDMKKVAGQLLTVAVQLSDLTGGGDGEQDDESAGKEAAEDEEPSVPGGAAEGGGDGEAAASAPAEAERSSADEQDEGAGGAAHHEVASRPAGGRGRSGGHSRTRGGRASSAAEMPPRRQRPGARR